MRKPLGYMDEIDHLLDPHTPKVEIPLIINRAIMLMDSLCYRIVSQHSNYARLTRADNEDLIQIVRTVEFKMLNQVAERTPEALSWVPRWEPAVSVRARSAIANYADSGAVTQVSGYTPSARRQRSLSRFRSELEQSSVEPITDEYLIDQYNDYIANARKSPRRQGAFATEADLNAPVRFYPSDPVERTCGVEADRASEIDASMDMLSIIRRVLAAAREEDVKLEQVAQLMLGWYPDGVQPTNAEVARELRIPTSTAGNRIHRVKEIFKEISGATVA